MLLAARLLARVSLLGRHPQQLPSGLPGPDGPAPSTDPCRPALQRSFPWWIVLGAVVLPCLYLPTLATRFDFIDDGNLVYPSGPMPLGQRLGVVGQKIVANLRHLGPFRPILWLHWEAEAELFGADAFHWRLGRLLWLGLATSALLWLMRELDIRPGAALIAAAVAMWNPYRNEIWTSLTLSEGVAMPYALLGLVCAIRAVRSPHPWKWDLAGALCLLAALGCKNTFAALVPAQCLLRVAPEGRRFRAGWKRHGHRACFLALTLLLPVLHYVLFKLTWHPGQYVLPGASWAQLGHLLWAIAGAISIDFLGTGLLLALLALWMNQRKGERTDLLVSPATAAWAGALPVWKRHRGACLGGLLLLAFGIGMYLPFDAISGRYTMPAVWGVDLWIAATLSELARVTARAWKRLAYVALGGGLAAVMLANLGRQDKFAARAALLWQTLECVEQQATAGTCIAWIESAELNAEEGIHFRWHLQGRGRSDLAVRLVDKQGRYLDRRELSDSANLPALSISGTAAPPPGGRWRLLKEFRSSYWAGQRSYQCYLWTLENQPKDQIAGS